MCSSVYGLTDCGGTLKVIEINNLAFHNILGRVPLLVLPVLLATFADVVCQLCYFTPGDHPITNSYSQSGYVSTLVLVHFLPVIFAVLEPVVLLDYLHYLWQNLGVMGNAKWYTTCFQINNEKWSVRDWFAHRAAMAKQQKCNDTV